jgi:hypothetical protein
MAPRVHLKGYLKILLVPFAFGTGSVFAQQPPSHLSAPPQSPDARPGKFQERIDAAVPALRENNPRFTDLSPQYVQGLVEFVSGNMLFVLLHEMAHVSITQMGLPVLTGAVAGEPSTGAP